MKTKLEMGTKFQLNKNNAKRFLGVNLFYCHEARVGSGRQFLLTAYSPDVLS